MAQRIRHGFFSLILAGFLISGAMQHTAAAAGPTKLTMSYAQKTVDFLPLMIASDAGYFKKHNLDVTLRYLPAQEGIPAIITGQVQSVAIGGADASSAEAQGTKLKLVATLSPVYTFQFWARPKFASATALKGQRVGITSTTGSLYAGTLLALHELGLKITDVAITPLGGSTNVNNSLLAGSIAAASSHPPATYKFEQAGFVDLVDLAKKQLPSVSAGVWFTEAYLKQHRDVVQNVVDSVLQGLAREKSDRAYTEAEITKYFKIKDKKELDFTYNFYINEVLGSGPMPNASAVAANIKALQASNPKLKNIDPESMVDQSFVKAAKQ